MSSAKITLIESVPDMQNQGCGARSQWRHKRRSKLRKKILIKQSYHRHRLHWFQLTIKLHVLQWKTFIMPRQLRHLYHYTVISPLLCKILAFAAKVLKIVWPEQVDLFRASWHESQESLSQLFFFFFYQVITCCLLFMHAVFSFSLSVLPLSVTPFEVFGSPVVFKRSEKGNPYCPIEGRPWDNPTLPPVLTALCQHHWCDCTHTSSSHLLSLVHCSFLLTHTVTRTQQSKCTCSV